MPENTYTGKVGDIECVAISDGSFPYPPQLFLASIPPDALGGGRAGTRVADRSRARHVHLFGIIQL